MTASRSLFWPTLLLLGATVIGCQRSEQAVQAKPNGLAGYWQLSRLECFCPPNTPTPAEAIAFDPAGKVTEYADGRVRQTGTYQISTGNAPCHDNAPVVTITWAGPTAAEPGKAAYTISGRDLVLDYGLCLDASRKTYTFVASQAPTR